MSVSLCWMPPEVPLHPGSAPISLRWLPHRRVYGMAGVYVHDATALAAVVRPELFEWHKGAVLVVTDGPAKGHTIRDEGA